MATNTAGYIIAYSDENYEGPSILPQTTVDGAIPRCIYKTVDGAEKGLQKWVKSLPFSPALYGEVFPFENTTARNELEKKGSALYGWVKDELDDGSFVQYGVYIMALTWG
jgi:hypothetical protein